MLYPLGLDLDAEVIVDFIRRDRNDVYHCLAPDAKVR